MSHIQELATCHACILKGWDVLACRQTSQMLEVVGGKGSLAVQGLDVAVGSYLTHMCMSGGSTCCPIRAHAHPLQVTLQGTAPYAARGVFLDRQGSSTLVRKRKAQAQQGARRPLEHMWNQQTESTRRHTGTHMQDPSEPVSSPPMLSWAVPIPARACLEPRMLSNEDRGAAAG